jgi:hypothetical protein
MERQTVKLFIIYVESSGLIGRKCDSFVYFQKLLIGIRTVIQLWKPPLQQISTEVTL